MSPLKVFQTFRASEAKLTKTSSKEAATFSMLSTFIVNFFKSFLMHRAVNNHSKQCEQLPHKDNKDKLPRKEKSF